MSDLDQLSARVEWLSRELRAVKELLPGDAQVLHEVCLERRWPISRVMVRGSTEECEAMRAMRARLVSYPRIARVFQVGVRTVQRRCVGR